MQAARAVVLGILGAAAFATSSVAQYSPLYSVQFGELRGRDHSTLVPTRTIKLCENATGYRYGVQISGPVSYDFYLIVKSPAATDASSHDANAYAGRQTVRTETVHASMDYIYAMWFDPGDRAGRYNIELFANDVRVASFDYNVVAGETCP